MAATPVDLSVDPNTVPPELKAEGADWFAIFNPATAQPGDGSGAPSQKRSLDVQLMHTLIHESVVCCVRFSPDGKFLATGCNRTAQIYDTATGDKIFVFEHPSTTGDMYVRSLCFDPAGRWLVTGGEDKVIRVWDIARRKIWSTLEGHQQEVYALDFSLDGRLIVSGSADSTVRMWDLTDESMNKVLNMPETNAADTGVTSVCISPDGRLVAAASLNTVVYIWDAVSGHLVDQLKGHRDSVYSVAFMPDGLGLISASLDKTLKYWDVRPLLGARNHETSEASPSGSNDAGLDSVKEDMGKLRIERGGGGESQCTMDFVGHKDYVLSVAVSRDGKWVVSGSKDRGVRFWDAQTAAAQCMLQGHKGSVVSLDLSPAGNVLATGGGDCQVRIWKYQAV